MALTPFPQTLPANTLVGRLGIGSGPAEAIPMSQVLSSWTNTINSVSNNYTLQTSDSGKTLALGGNAFYTLTFPAASGFVPTFLVFVVNTDGWASGRGKRIVSTGGNFTDFILWPQQTAIIYNVNSIWLVYKSNRAQLPNGTVNFFTNASLGTDTIGATDGLATGASAFQTVNQAVAVIGDQFNFNFQQQTSVIMNVGANDTNNIHYPSHAGPAPGAQGRAALILDGGGFTLSGGIDLFFQTTYLQIRNMTLATKGITISEGGQLLIGDTGAGSSGVTFGACPGERHMFIQSQGSIRCDGAYTISGGANVHVDLDFGFYGGHNGANTVSANVTFSVAVFNSVQGRAELDNTTFTLGGNVVTGKKYNVVQNGVISGSVNIPGTVAGTTASGGQAV